MLFTPDHKKNKFLRVPERASRRYEYSRNAVINKNLALRLTCTCKHVQVSLRTKHIGENHENKNFVRDTDRNLVALKTRGRNHSQEMPNSKVEGRRLEPPNSRDKALNLEITNSKAAEARPPQKPLLPVPGKPIRLPVNLRGAKAQRPAFAKLSKVSWHVRRNVTVMAADRAAAISRLVETSKADLSLTPTALLTISNKPFPTRRRV
jgi:hypothetical protein